MTEIPLRGFTPPQSTGEGAVSPAALRLHLGCGRTILPGWVNVDQVQLPGVDVVADLEQCRSKPLPFGEDSVDEFLMSHVIEHVRDTLGLMQELHRIAKVGALLVARTPYGSSDDAWEDPTHVRPYFIQSWGYFSMPYWWRTDLGYRADWQPETLRLAVDEDETRGLDPHTLLRKVLRERNFVQEMIVTLRAVKPIRGPKRELQILPKIEFLRRKRAS